MQIIVVPELRVAQFQTFSNKALDITKDLKELAPQVAEAKALYDIFVAGMTRDQASSDKKLLDRTRDKLNTGFFNAVMSEQIFPHESETAKVLDQLVKITDEYGFELSRLTYDEQTAQTDNMLKKIEALDLSALPSLSRWIEPLKTANDNFKAVSDEYFQQLNASKDTKAATEAAEPLVDALNKLFTLLFSHANVTGSAELIKAYKELTTLVSTYK
ncbi:DUF6261 family protein [Reichenbachiella ulvae]|uniref:DUF6261 family protein n=1 Tax=Reichenbachiella ulvae TaxID=2980104 RepID=A0ABT3CUE7_9BACT|nr:DUF6261 family protein [Reichenbachiella ulvae]MCV9386863.1 DUF6261 family protein [Reichenbachiella ulvae]